MYIFEYISNQLFTRQRMLVKKKSKIKIATTYAQALYAAAVDKKCVDKVMLNVTELLDAYPDYQKGIQLLNNPVWAVDEKISALKAIAQKLKLNDELYNCLVIVAQNNRFSEFEDILQAFRQIYYAKHNMVEVKVESVVPLNTRQNNLLKSELEKFLKKEVLIEYNINPDILGGLVVRFNSEMIDDSLKGKLNRLESIMKGGQ